LESFIAQMSGQSPIKKNNLDPKLILVTESTLSTEPTLSTETTIRTKKALVTEPTLILENLDSSEKSALGTELNREKSESFDKSTITLSRFKALFKTKFETVIPPDDSNLTIPQLNKKYPNEMETMTSKI